MIVNLPQLDLSKLGVQNGYSKVIIELAIGTPQSNSGPYPSPMAPTAVDNPPTKVVATIQSETSDPMGTPEISSNLKTVYQFPLTDGKTITDVKGDINTALGLAPFIK